MMATAIEHFERVKKIISNLKWKNPRLSDTANIITENIFEYNIEGDWDISKEGFLIFTLRNHKQIENFVKNL